MWEFGQRSGGKSGGCKGVCNFFVYRSIFTFEVSFDRGEIANETYTIVYRGIVHIYWATGSWKDRPLV